MSVLKHIQAVILLPTMVTIAIPGIIIVTTRAVKIGWPSILPFNLVPLLTGTVLIGLGLTLMIKTIALFATIGQGTLAPWAPPGNLVVRGIYRHVRNPMISGVFCVLLGETMLFGSVPLFAWFIVFLLINVIYIPLLEEPGLEQRFGQEYRLYKENVPRWIPRLRPWNASGDG